MECNQRSSRARIGRHLPFDEGEDLAFPVSSEDTGRPGESSELQMPQVLVHGVRPWAHRPQQLSAASNDAVGHSPRGERNLLSVLGPLKVHLTKYGQRAWHARSRRIRRRFRPFSRRIGRSRAGEAPPPSRRHPVGPLELPREVALIGEAGVGGGPRQ